MPLPSQSRRSAPAIDRKALVQRHNVHFKAVDSRAPLTVGNGNFGFTVDVTGLQTLPQAYPAPGRYVEAPGTLLGTQSTWGWHSTPIAQEPSLELSHKEYASPRGPVKYVDLSGKTSATALDGGSEAETWLRNNPHRLMLGAISLAPESVNAAVLGADQLANIDQTLDLWAGLISSSFSLPGAHFRVETVSSPDSDAVAINIRSTGRQPPAVRFAFPYGSEAWGNAADWSRPHRHASELVRTPTGWEIRRVLDETRYTVFIDAGTARLTRCGPHEFLLTGGDGELSFCAAFAPAEKLTGHLREPLTFAAVKDAAARYWAEHWNGGGMIDFSGSTDARAHELERRVVLSQYLSAVNCSGAAPPQETGLMVNSWRGRFHLEMHWWHAAHFPLWGRGHLLTDSLDWYFKIIDGARDTARSQGFNGVRWPKQVALDGRESPSDIGPFLIWQQPHPIYLAELLWRNTQHADADSVAGRAILEKYAPLVFETAAFMQSFALPTPLGGQLPPPLVPAQESYGHLRSTVANPTFELAYWGWALDIAAQWRHRLGLPPIAAWEQTARTMAPPHSEGGSYSAMSAPPYTLRTDHPSMLAAFGVVPQTALIDARIMNATLDGVLADWDWASTWGWDYPMIAMTATRLGRPHDAVAALLMDRGKNTYLANGHNFQTEALPVYLPGNGGLLTAVALMAAGYDGGPPVPGFPQDGSWLVRAEGISPLP